MEDSITQIRGYLDFCKNQKRLNEKTLKAYQIDLNQLKGWACGTSVGSLSAEQLEEYIAALHSKYKPKTTKRKIASIKAFYRYMELKNIIDKNPFNKIQTRFREPIILPKTIPLHIIEVFLKTIYNAQETARTPYKRRNALRDTAVIELMFATGIRISELCSLANTAVNLYDKVVRIYGKGDKERCLQICNENVINVLEKYRENYSTEIDNCGYFFVNQCGRKLSDQSVRRMINKYCDMAAIPLHITPHMFRHTFATCLLEKDVDIRFIQEMLGHSSITITTIYTHVSTAKQRDILTSKHPRKDLNI